MAEFFAGNVKITSGSSTVRFVWRLGHGGTLTGAFVDDELLTWGGIANVGRFVSSTPTEIFVYMMLNTPEPVLNNTITPAVGSHASCTITSVPSISLPTFPGNPPNYSNSGGTGTQGVVSIGDLLLAQGDIVRTVSGGITRHSFVVAEVPADTFTNVEAVINRDRTPNHNLLRIRPGDKMQGAIMDKNMLLIDAAGLGGEAGPGGPPGPWVSFSPTAPWVEKSGYGAAPAYYLGNGRVHFRGVLHTNGTLVRTGSLNHTISGALALQYQPGYVLVAGAGSEKVRVASNGSMTIESPVYDVPVDYLDLNAISWKVGAT